MFHHAAENALESVSVIVGNGQSLADQTGIVVVNQFRNDDLFMGGQGAPFAPLFHYALAKRDRCIPLVVVNCGGISNVTIIPNENPLDLIAFDTGAGNGLIDLFVLKSTRGIEYMDKDGRYGKKGKVDTLLLSLLYEKSITKEGQNYFLMKPPKSLDIRDLELIPELFQVDFCDACRTLEEFTADSIVKSVKSAAEGEHFEVPNRWVLAGGGFQNPVIREALEVRLRQCGMEACTADEIGWNNQALEAKIFAYLAVRSIMSQPISFPKTTGVPRPMSGGRVFFPV
jgi:anhydro-N-acetylmuramic acid kinase